LPSQERRLSYERGATKQTTVVASQTPWPAAPAAEGTSWGRRLPSHQSGPSV